MGDPVPPIEAHRSNVYRTTQALVARYLQRYWYRAAQGAGGLGDLFVTVEEMAAELEIGALRPPIPLPDPDDLAQRLAQLRAQVAAHLARHPDLPAARLMRQASLRPEAAELLFVQTTLQSAPGLLRSCTFAWADFAVKQPTVAFLVELLADDAPHRSRLELALAVDGPLRRLHILHLGDDKRWQPSTPLLHRPVRVPDAVYRFLNGWATSAEAVPHGSVSLETEGPAPGDLVLADPNRAGRVLGAVARGEDPLPVLLIGQSGAGRRTVARAFALDSGLTLYTIDLGAFAWELEPFERQLSAALRDAMLSGAVALLRCECFQDRGDRRPPVMGRVIRTMRTRVILTAEAENVQHIVRALPDMHVIDIDARRTDLRERVYQRLIEQHRFQASAAEQATLVESYKLHPGDLDRALRDLRISEPGREHLDPVALDLAIRRQVRTNLTALAQPITTSQSWEDLVVNEEQRVVIDEIMTHARLRYQVFEKWGFARKLGGRGMGLSCLFSGPPGTGKTMTATLIAQALGLDLYQVDLSRIVDKYVGETEKNLARLFDEAARVPVILLFDEADSLFAKRTNVESSNDRYANLEVNFLLQKMESHDGISILTTNLGTSIDEAFKRRLRFRLHFDLPKVDERAILWRSMVPPGCDIAEDVDWHFLAKRWDIAGGIIRNAVVRAAFLAAARGEPLGNELLQQAARSEMIELGRLG